MAALFHQHGMANGLTLAALHTAIRRQWPDRGLTHEGFTNWRRLHSSLSYGNPGPP